MQNSHSFFYLRSGGKSARWPMFGGAAPACGGPDLEPRRSPTVRRATEVPSPKISSREVVGIDGERA